MQGLGAESLEADCPGRNPASTQPLGCVTLNKLLSFSELQLPQEACGRGCREHLRKKHMFKDGRLPGGSDVQAESSRMSWDSKGRVCGMVF